jgi:RES domain-containing protein
VTRTLWRIVKKKYAATAFDGEGARLFGGRWNSRGTRVVYVSSTRSLAALETLVHLNPPVLFEFGPNAIELDHRLIKKAPTLPLDWKEEPPGPSSQKIGDLWVTEARSVALELPSAIVPGESNYLLNPAHPDFKACVIRAPEPFSFDPRLL